MTYDCIRPRRKLSGLAKDLILTALNTIPIPLPALPAVKGDKHYDLETGEVFRFNDQTWKQIQIGVTV